MRIHVEDLTVCREDFLLNNVSFSVEQGEYAILLGPSGSGKSTIVKSIAGLINIDSGKITIGDKVVNDLPAEKRNIGYVSQHYSLFPNLNVEENIRFGMRIKKYTEEKMKKQIEKLSILFKIDHLLKRSVANLSGGERQRVAFARTLAVDPAVLLLDEPFSAIDEGLKRGLWFELKEILKKLGQTVIHITHNLDEAYVLGEKTGVIIDGVLNQFDTNENVFMNPSNKKVASFLNYNNIFSGNISEDENGKFADMENFKIRCDFPEEYENVTVCLRPGDIKIVREDIPLKNQIKRNVFTGSIFRTIFFPEYTTILFKLEKSTKEYDFEITFPAYIYKRHDLYDGKKISIAFWEERIIIFKQ